MKNTLNNLNEKNSKLIKEVEFQTKTIESQTKTIENQTEQIKDQTKTIEDQTSKIESQTKTIEDQTSRIDYQTSRIENQTSKISSLESKLEGSLEVIQSIRESQEIITKIVQKTNDKQIEIINKYIPPEVIGRNQTKEVILFIYSPSLNITIRNELPDLEIDSDEIILDTISCQLRDEKNHLDRHKYDSENDEIIIRKEMCNSLDLNKFIKNYSKQAKELKGKGKFFRKFIINKFKIEEFKNEFNNYVEDLQKRHRGIIGSLKNSSKDVSFVKNNMDDIIQNYINNEYYDTDENESDVNRVIAARVEYLTRLVENVQTNQIETNKQIEIINSNQNETKEKISNLENRMSSIFEKLRSLDPNVKNFQIKRNHYYHDIQINENGEVTYARVRNKSGEFSDYQILTEEEFKNSIFRDKDNPRNIYNPNKKN